MMMGLFLLLIVFSLQSIKFAQHGQELIPWPTLGDSPWPMFAHDPQFTGRSPYKGPQKPNIIWTRDVPDSIFSGPIIGEEGNLYFGSYYQLSGADYFYSITPDNEERWLFNLGTDRPPQTGILVDSSNTIYFGSLDGYFYALDSDGTLKWKYETSAAIVEKVVPNIDLEGRVYITNGLGELYSFNPDGTLNWNVSYDVGFYKKSPVFSPDGNTIYICGSENHLYALNLDGSLKWRLISGNIIHQPLIDSRGYIYIIPKGQPQYFYCLNSDGETIWKKGIVLSGIGSLEVQASPTIDHDGNIYALLWDSTFTYSNHRALFSFTPDGEVRWKYIFEFGGEVDDLWQPLICDKEGTLFLGSTFGTFYYAISNEGKLLWKLPLNEYQVDNTGAISADGTLYIGVHRSSLWNGHENNLIVIKDSIDTDVEEQVAGIPDKFGLEQNYPNPFNPETAISYSLPKSGLIKLEVFNTLGKKVETLVNKFKKAGSYRLIFNGSNLPSGVYFYRIITYEFIDTKKMILMK